MGMTKNVSKRHKFCFSALRQIKKGKVNTLTLPFQKQDEWLSG